MWTSLGLNQGPPDYESTGVMMNTLPSWTGENWTLNVGITGIDTNSCWYVYPLTMAQNLQIPI